ncbi:hypothetical protein PsorP6_009999 [Peronosclerospora sorghi]|uniref:Uncharacterized protein n=1 Tax=Peronosclerospora sorghi TaxID=230839 RepID=A0ACC0VWE0_9STRA|nr:hypothetical protein PsorP6_009999 [Peronosclerospora sorghi]
MDEMTTSKKCLAKTEKKLLNWYDMTDTKIDWSTYMQQVELFKGGERDNMNIRGDTGPLVYPASFLYVFSLLHSVTDDGQNIRVASMGRRLLVLSKAFCTRSICYASSMTVWQ